MDQPAAPYATPRKAAQQIRSWLLSIAHLRVRKRADTKHLSREKHTNPGRRAAQAPCQWLRIGGAASFDAYYTPTSDHLQGRTRESIRTANP